MTKEERLIRSYFDSIKDINQNKSIEVLPLTLIDMLLEYAEILNEATVKRSELIDFLAYTINENLVIKPSTYEDIVHEYLK